MLGDKVKQYRATRGMTQKEFSKLLGIGRSTLSEIETGKIKGTADFVQTLAEKTDQPLLYWLDTEESNLSLKDMQGLYILVETLVDTGALTKDNPLPKKYEKALLDMLKFEIQNYINKKEIKKED